MSAPTHVVTLPMDGCECFRCQQLRMAQLTPAKAFEAEAVKAAQSTVEQFKRRLADEQQIADTAARFQERLAAERAMADTVAVGSDEEVRTLRKDNAVLVTRIEGLEHNVKALATGLTTHMDLINRIAYVLRTFYYAELSMSSVQPLLALCLELNPDIVEQRR